MTSDHVWQGEHAIRAGTVLPARRSPVTLHTADGLSLVGEIAVPEDRPPVATLVTLHPLPTHGGFMDSHVLRKASFRLPALAGVAVLRFNTRGTSSPHGTSEGMFDNAEDERYDVAAAIEAAEFADDPPLPHRWLLGWSFGTDLALMHGLDPSIEGAILLSPPLRFATDKHLDAWAASGKPVLALVPELDDYLRPDEARRRFARVAQAEVIGVDGAKHLWVGEPAVRRVLDEIVKRVAPDSYPLPTEWPGADGACNVRVMTVVDLHAREAGSGLPVVLLHAFPLSSAMWLEQRNDLADGFRIITPDLRGFGGSQLGYDEPSLDHLADDVAALLDTLALDRVVLGGLSMGGYAAMAFLRRHGDRVAGLLLADTKASADTEAARANRHRIADALDESGTTQVLLDDVLPALMGETTVVERPMIQGRVRALVEDAPPAAAAWAQRAMAARPDSFDTLRAVTVPALVIAGEQDALSSVADAQAMVDALPDARLVVVPRSGHLTAVEAPEAFNAAAREFLSALS